MAKQLAKAEQIDRTFATLVRGRIVREGFEVVGRLQPGLIVSVADSQYIGIVSSRSSDREGDKRIVTNVHELSSGKRRPVRTVVVKSMLPSEDYRKRMTKSFGVDVIELSEIGQYLREWQEIFADIDDEPKPKAKPRATPSARIKVNSDAIIMLAKSLALQIDAKLESLRQAKPNSDEAMAARDTAIVEYEALRARVGELETAVAKLKWRNPKTAPAVKAGTAFGKTVSKWWDKSGSKHLDNAASMGIVMSSAGVLALMGVDVGWAAAVSAYVVTGKAPRGLFKAGVGH